MRRPVALLTALAACLALAPAAAAAPFTVTSAADPGDGTCDADCTLREAIDAANATPDSDTIGFDAAITTIAPLTALPAIAQPAIVDGGGDVTIEAPPADTTGLLRFSAASSQLRSITLRGTGAGSADRLLHVTGSGFGGTSLTLADAAVWGAQLAGANGSLSGVQVSGSGATGLVLSGSGTSATGAVVSNPGGTGIHVSGSGASLSGPTVTGADGTGIAVPGGSASIQGPQVSGAAGAGIDIAGSGVTVSGGSVHGNGGPGIRIAGQNDVVTQTILYGNGGRPIELAGGNGGIQPPANLRIGPRRADGSLPLTGSTGGGAIEVFSGNPFSAAAPSYFGAFAVDPGDFTYNFPSEPPPGSTFALTVRSGGTSEFALVTVPGDVVSPEVMHARAVSTTEVKIMPSEPVDPATVEPGDFRLLMAGAERPITAAGVAPDGAIVLTSSGWKPGEAGYVDLGGPGALTDASGNATLVAARYRVAAAPGDFIAPIATRMKLSPKSVCLTRGRRCRRAGATLTFVATEEGKVEMVVQRGNKRVGTRTFTVKPGVNRIKFDGRLRGRKLRAGRYRLLLFMTDIVGNRNPNPPITLFSIRRVTK